MKKGILFVILLLMTGAMGHPVWSRPAKGASSTMQINRFRGETITHLKVSNVITVELSQGENTGIDFQFDSRLEPYLVCELKNGKLTIGFNNLPKELQSSSKWSTKATATITVSRLDGLDVSGVCTVNGRTAFTSTNTHFNFAGVSNLKNMKLKTQTAKLDISGVCGLQNLEISAEENLTVNVSGTSKVDMTAHTDRFRSTVSGVAKLTVSGKADYSNTTVSGSSNCNMVNFEVDNVTISVSGASAARCWAIERLVTTASGVGSISYKGDPEVKFEGKASSVSRIK